MDMYCLNKLVIAAVIASTRGWSFPGPCAQCTCASCDGGGVTIRTDFFGLIILLASTNCHAFSTVVEKSSLRA